MRAFASLLASVALAAGLLSAQARAAITPSPKIAVIVLENTERADVVGQPAAPFMNAMIAQGTEFTDYHGFAGSAHDYRAMVGGEQTASVPVSNNLYHQFDAEGVGWVNLEESMGGNCGVDPSPNLVPGSGDVLYANGHDPAYQYRANTTCGANDQPLTSDAQLQSLPSFSYIVPNNCDNAHTFPTGGDCPAYFGTNHGSGSDRARGCVGRARRRGDHRCGSVRHGLRDVRREHGGHAAARLCGCDRSADHRWRWRTQPVTITTRSAPGSGRHTGSRVWRRTTPPRRRRSHWFPRNRWCRARNVLADLRAPVEGSAPRRVATRSAYRRRPRPRWRPG